MPEPAHRERIGRYELRFELASGGMGSVYLARVGGAAGFQKLVALKRIHRHLAKQTGYVNMFLDEAKIASRITHPNVCSVFDFGEADGEYYLAMEYLNGEPLSRVLTRLVRDPALRRDPLLPLCVARIVADACEGLHAAHELKDANGDLLSVVHRDVNPRNLFVAYNGIVQVVDFGVASARERIQHTATGQMKGSSAYMAPEQVRSDRVDRRTDVWGLGVSLWEMLAVRRLFKRETTANTMYAVLFDEIEPPSRFRSQVSKELDAIVLKALAREPRERWQSARELGQALRRFLGTQPTVVGPVELSEWMSKLFPQGEARKAQLMEIARLEAVPIPSIEAPRELDVSYAKTETEFAPLPSRPRSSRLRTLALFAGAILMVGAVAFVLGGVGPSAKIEPSSVVAEDLRSVEVAAPLEPDPATEPTRQERTEPTPPPKPVVEPTVQAKKPTVKRRARSKPRASTNSGTINLVTRGGWAEIFQNGKSLGNTPRRLTLPAGRHKLVLKPADGTPKRVVVDVEPGRTKQVSIPLN